MILAIGFIVMLFAWILARLTLGHWTTGWAFLIGVITFAVGLIRLAAMYLPW